MPDVCIPKPDAELLLAWLEEFPPPPELEELYHALAATVDAADPDLLTLPKIKPGPPPAPAGDCVVLCDDVAYGPFTAEEARTALLDLPASEWPVAIPLRRAMPPVRRVILTPAVEAALTALSGYIVDRDVVTLINAITGGAGPSQRNGATQ